MYKVFILIVCLFSFGCKEGYKSYVDAVDKSNGYGEEKVVLDSMFRFYARNINSNFDTIFTLYSSDYLAKLRQYVHFAIYGEKELLQKMDFITKSNALSLRHNVPLELLQEGDLLQILKKKNGLGITLLSDDAEIVDIIFENPNKASFVYKSVLQSGSLLFTKENGAWKLDPEGDPIVQSIIRKKIFSNMTKDGTTEENILQYIATGDFKGELNWEPLIKK